LTQGYSSWRREDASWCFAFNEDQMRVSGFGPASHFNLNEFQHRLGEVARSTSPNNAPSKLPRVTSTQLPHPALSRRAANTPERAGAGEESTEPLDVQPSPQSHLTHDAGTSVVDVDDPRAFDVDSFRRWWRQSSTREAAQTVPVDRN
jgi:hypothetical protein